MPFKGCFLGDNGVVASPGFYVLDTCFFNDIGCVLTLGLITFGVPVLLVACEVYFDLLLLAFSSTIFYFSNMVLGAYILMIVGPAVEPLKAVALPAADDKTVGFSRSTKGEMF